MGMNLMSTLLLLLKKDLVLEWRTKEFITASLVFGMLIVVVLNFGIRLTNDQWATAGPGILWVCFILSGIIGVGRAFQNDFDNESNKVFHYRFGKGFIVEARDDDLGEDVVLVQFDSGHRKKVFIDDLEEA